MDDDWASLEEKLETAICEVMLNDEWSKSRALTVGLKSMLEMHAPPGVKSQAARIVELLNAPLAKMPDGQRGDLANALLDLLRLVHRKGLAND